MTPVSERYPDKLRRVLVCPANFMFSTFWSVIKYSMPERVRNKVRSYLAHVSLVCLCR